jgi:hypothetical protein
MKGSWAVLVTAAALVGCRSSQPTANPFLRTTVAPPATGQGAVVSPGEPYYPGAAPQGMPPVTAAPQGAVPLGPPPVGPPVVTPPPPVLPQRDKYSPPGGSYQYHQSSIDRSGGDKGQDGGGRAAKTQLTQGPAEASIDEAAPDGLKLAGPSDAVEQAVALSNESDPVLAASYHQAEVRDAREVAATDEGDEPPERQPRRSSARSLSSNAVSIVGARAADPAEALASGDVASSDDETGGQDNEVALAPAATVTADAPSVATADATQAADIESSSERPRVAKDGSGADYAFAPDYTSLSGRLEYSQSSRQWKLRYIPIDGQTDSYGGSVVLRGSPQLESFKPGDQVAVRGSLAAKSSAAASFSPLYQLDRIEPLVR